jgi:hypothetical protein
MHIRPEVGKQTFFSNPQILKLILQSQNPKLFRCASPQIANPQIFMTNPQIVNTQIITKYLQLSPKSPKSCLFKTIFLVLL